MFGMSRGSSLVRGTFVCGAEPGLCVGLARLAKARLGGGVRARLVSVRHWCRERGGVISSLIGVSNSDDVSENWSASSFRSS